jgi:hypothetical protein
MWQRQLIATNQGKVQSLEVACLQSRAFMVMPVDENVLVWWRA